MAVRVFIIDLTGNGRPPAILDLEGKISASGLRHRCATALSLMDSAHFEVEVLDTSGLKTNTISPGCTVFLSHPKNNLPRELLEGVLRDVFDTIFGKKRT